MLLSLVEDQMLQEYAESLGCKVYKNTFPYLNVNKYKQDKLNTTLGAWCIVLNDTVIIARPSGNSIYKTYYRSSILTTESNNGVKYYSSNSIPMERYKGTTLEKMKTYIKHQVERLEKIKQREIKKKLEIIENDFKEVENECKDN